MLHEPMLLPIFPKKRHLGPQNSSGSSELEKLLKIVSCIEIENIKELMVAFQMEYVGVHKYPRGSLGPQNGSGSSGPKNLLKIVSCVETEKMKEMMVWVQLE